MDRKIRIAAAGDNCMDVYDKEGKEYPGGNPLNVDIAKKIAEALNFEWTRFYEDE